MAGDDARACITNFHQRFERGNHSADPPSRRVVDDRIKTIPEQVAGMQDVRPLEIHVAIAVGVRGGNVRVSHLERPESYGSIQRKRLGRHPERAEWLEGGIHRL
jgi:hypothetical protein